MMHAPPRRRVGQRVRPIDPVLLGLGEQDQVLPAAQAEPLRAHGRVEVLASTGHSPHMEAANEVNRLLGAFLDDLEEQPR